MSDSRPAPLALTPRPPQGAAQPAALVRVSSAQLFGGSREVEIEHHGVVYRLKQTALGKLILTK